MHSWTSEIYIFDISTNSVQSVLKTDYGNLEAKSWSPDGSVIAFASECGGDWPEGIWLINTNGTGSKQLLTEGYDAAWAPEGNRMAIFSTSLVDGRETRVLSIMDLNTKETRVVFTGSAKYTTTLGLAWSPDGTRLMFSFGKQDRDVTPRFVNVDVYILNTVTGEILKETREGVNFHPAWSPDGRLIAYVRTTAGDFDPKLIISYVDGQCSREVSTSAWSVDWSPNGKQVAFENAGNIYTLEVTSFLCQDLQTTDYLCH